jgi:hypothetical protein
LTSRVEFDELFGGEGDEGLELLRPQKVGRQIAQLQHRLTLFPSANNLKKETMT